MRQQSVYHQETLKQCQLDMQTNKQTKQQTTAGTFLLGAAEVLGNICDVGYI